MTIGRTSNDLLDRLRNADIGLCDDAADEILRLRLITAAPTTHPTLTDAVRELVTRYGHRLVAAEVQRYDQSTPEQVAQRMTERFRR